MIFYGNKHYPTVAAIRCSRVASGGSSLSYTAKVSTTPRWFDFNNLNGEVKTPFPVALARKMLSRSSCKIKVDSQYFIASETLNLYMQYATDMPC